MSDLFINGEKAEDNAIKALMETNDKLREKIAQYGDALKWYADLDNYQNGGQSNVISDWGKTAQDVLKWRKDG